MIRVKSIKTEAFLRHDTKPSDDEASVLELWGMWSTPSLPLLPGPLSPGVVVLVKILSKGQVELFDQLAINKSQMLNWITMDI